MKKRITSLLLIAVMVLSMTVSVSAANPFTDLTADWYKPAVDWAYNTGAVAGTSDTTFSPSMNVTRGMLVTMLYRLAGKPSVSGTSGFTDVPTGQYYSDAVAWAAKNNVVSGYPGNKFGPNDDITRQDIVVIMYRYAGTPAFTKTADFADASDVSDYAKTAVQWAKANNIVSGKGNNKFDPKATATRAEIAQILYNYFTKDTDEHTHNYVPEITLEPTCTATGTRTYTCDCGKSYHESIPAKGHTWETETIHHDAVTGTRDVTETWTHATLYFGFALTPKGLAEMPELANNEAGDEYVVKVMEYCYKGTVGPKGQPGEIDPLWDEVEWIYKYKDADNPPSALKKDIALKRYELDGINVSEYLNGANYSGRVDSYTEDRVVGTETYVITDAYDETVTTCTICGAHS